jgi:CheY-like chemotaxis protein
VVPATATPQKPGEQPLRILLVEDHEPTRAVLSQLLVRRHYDVTSAGSMAEARSCVDKNNGQFNLVISDIGLPDGSGYDLMQELGERYHLKGIALTGYGMEHDIARARTAGFVVHLTKPVQFQSLDSAIDTALNGK